MKKKIKSNPIYVVSTVRVYNSEYGERSDSRAVGWFETFKDAEEIVIGNYGDIEEAGYYTYAVIEKVEPGLYRFDLDAVWYKFRGRKKITAKRIKCPKKFKSLVGFGIG